MSTSLRRNLTRATQTRADLLSLRTNLARTIEAFSELDLHPEDEAAILDVRRRLDAPSDYALATLDALLAREEAREREAQAAVDAAEREEQASEDRDAGPIALSL